MKIQLMIEVVGHRPDKSVEAVQESERRYLKLYGLEKYLEGLVKTQLENGGHVNFDLRVKEE